MTNSADPDQLASSESEANCSGGSTLFAKVYPGSAEQGLNKYGCV